MGVVLYAGGIPPLKAKSFAPCSVVSFFIRLMGLKWSSKLGLSAAGMIFLVPKKIEGLVAREMDRVRALEAGLDETADVVAGVNV